MPFRSASAIDAAAAMRFVEYHGRLYQERRAVKALQFLGTPARQETLELDRALVPGWYMDVEVESKKKHILYGPFDSESAVSQAYYYRHPFTFTWEDDSDT
jgi:hypothetical protein